MEVFFTDLAALRSLEAKAGIDGTQLVDVIRHHGISDGMPFILDDSGAYDERFNSFFRNLPNLKVRSANSWRNYALDLLTWMRFLAECLGKTIWMAEKDDIKICYRIRRITDPETAIDASSWNRFVAALDKFYKWAVEEHFIDSVPFTYTYAVKTLGSGITISVEHNTAYEDGARHGDMKFISLADYITFRDVGLRGRLPDGSEDVTFRGRNGERNALFADLLVVTGMRLEEASSLLTRELPNISEDAIGKHTSRQPNDRSENPAPKAYRMALAPPITKGSKGRSILIPKRILLKVSNYVSIERANAVARARAIKRYDAMQGRTLTIAAGRISCQVQTSKGIVRLPYNSSFR